MRRAFGGFERPTMATVLTAGLAPLLFSACATVPAPQHRLPSVSLTDTEGTSLGRDVARWTASHDGLSGFYPLPTGLDALGARLALIDRAERSIDVQYFLLKQDRAGIVFADALLRAADRGVRIRVLLDDVFTTADDTNLVGLDHHPNIEVRLFNPLARGGFQWLNFLWDFKRANRRMHNKSFTVDNQVAIVGGRNIAEEYFQLKQDSEFIDFDMLALGPITAGISTHFDRYWNHELALPIADVARRGGDLESFRRRLAVAVETGASDLAARAVAAPQVQELLDRQARLVAAPAEVISDDPTKLLNKVARDQQLVVTRMAEVVAEAESEVLIVNPYFIPRRSGLDFLSATVGRGVNVTVLTNSLASTNHVAVHSSYAGYRERLLEAGVDLREARANATPIDQETGERLQSLTVHTKLIAVDRRYLFVGSLNLDPRAIDINTEMGVLIDAPELTGPLVDRIRARLSGASYRLQRDARGNLQWVGDVDGVPVVETREPLTGRWLRFKAWVLKLVPEGQL